MGVTDKVMVRGCLKNLMVRHSVTSLHMDVRQQLKVKGILSNNIKFLF